MSKYNKNCVLSGSLDYYCLVCEDYLRGEEQVESHILKPEHKKAFNQTSYAMEFPKDRIRRVKNGYYCEYCNTLLMNSIAVRIHVADDRHVLNSTDEPEEETTKHFRRVANAIIALNDMLIDDQAWNAFVSDCCLLCDIELKDGGDLHKNETVHILNVIQSKIKMDVDSNLFRKMNTPTLNQHFQCLTCNELLPEKSYSDHFSSLDHKKKRLQCRKAKRAMLSAISATNKDKEVINNTEPPKLDTTVKVIKKPKEDIEKSKQMSIKNDKKSIHEPDIAGNCSNKCQENASVGKVNEIKESPKVQSKSVISDSAINDKLKSEQQHKTTNDATGECSNESKKNTSAGNVNKIKNTPKVQMKDGIITDINERLGIKDYIFHIPNSVTAMCLLCEWVVPANCVGMHVNDSHHQTMSKLQKEWFEKNRQKKVCSSDINDKVVSANKIEAVPNNKNVKVTMKVENTGYKESINKSEVNNEPNNILKVQEKCKKIEKDKQETIKSNTKAAEIRNDNESTIDKNKVSRTVLEVKNTDSIENVHEPKVTNEPNDNKSKIFKSYDYFKNNGIHIDFVLDTALCRKCSEPIDFNCGKIKKHITVHKKANKSGKSKPVIVNACNQSQGSTSTEILQIETCSTFSKTNDDTEPKMSKSFVVTKNENEPVAKSYMSETKNDHEAEGNGSILAQKNEKAPEKDIKSTLELASKTAELPSLETEQPESVYTEANNDKNEVKNNDSVEINDSNDSESVEQFAQNNNIAYNISYKKSFCNVCEIFIPTTLMNLKEHVKGEKHSQAMQRKAGHSKRRLSENTQKQEACSKVDYESMRMNDFVHHTTEVDTHFRQDIIINEEICIGLLSFMMMTCMGDRLRCQVCEANFSQDQANNHKSTKKHLLAMKETPVIVSLHEEFVRVLRPNYFHCGFCNFVEFGWDSLQNHLISETHRQKKTSAKWLLREYLPDIQRHRLRQMMQLMEFAQLLNINM